MKKEIYRNDTRGFFDYGWLKTYHSFSFSGYFDDKRIHFGKLRVLNDDTIAPASGFGLHPHDNMEIISIPLEGDLEHRDSMGNVSIIKNGDIQVMSAGTGIRHSEYNRNPDKRVKFLQIWIIPNKRDVTPRYDQLTLQSEYRNNKLQQIISPNSEDEGLWIHQDAWLHLSNLTDQEELEYKLNKPGNGVYIFVLRGSINIAEDILTIRDGIGIWDTDSIVIKSGVSSEILLIEVPMNF